MFAVYRFGAHIPVPGINRDVIAGLLSGNLFGMLDTFSGGSFKNFTIFAMGIMPYINASIIMNLLTVIIPYFERLAKEGTEGRKKMAEYTRYGTIILGFVQAIAMTSYFRAYGALENPGFMSMLVIAITVTAGTTFLMWLGELITEKGIGNGISLIIFAGIVSRLPSGLMSIWSYLKGGQTNVFTLVIFAILALIIIAGVVTIQEGERKIPVQYAKRVIGRKMYGGQSSHIPIKVNQVGVIPIIFAMSLLALPTTIAGFFPTNSFAAWITRVLDYSHPAYIITYALLILFFTYFYTAVTFNPVDIADNIKKNGGFIPGLRPGRPTADYLDRVMSKITLAGAVFLTIIALMPNIAIKLSGLNIYFGGTSLLIVVGVALETMKQLESHMLMRHYQGFMK